eukprot:SAG31_NODE_255_length_19039_cov_83.461774_11_plen_180_part_00
MQLQPTVRPPPRPQSGRAGQQMLQIWLHLAVVIRIPSVARFYSNHRRWYSMSRFATSHAEACAACSEQTAAGSFPVRAHPFVEPADRAHQALCIRPRLGDSVALVMAHASVEHSFDSALAYCGGSKRSGCLFVGSRVACACQAGIFCYWLQVCADDPCIESKFVSCPRAARGPPRTQRQ